MADQLEPNFATGVAGSSILTEWPPQMHYPSTSEDTKVYLPCPTGTSYACGRERESWPATAAVQAHDFRFYTH